MKKMADMMSRTGKWLLVFGFIFSQLSFPLEVLADELTDDENTYQEVAVVTEDTDTLNPDESNDIQTEEPVIKINGEEATEYTINESTEVTLVLEYQGETKTEVLDFSKKLYGTYQYTFTSVEEVVTINYLGNNADLLKQYENVSDLTKNISCNEVECVISGFGADLVTVADINAYYNLVAFESDYNVIAVVTDGEKILLDTDTVLNGYELEIVDNLSEVVLENGVLVNTTPASTYTINRVGDVFVPSDGLIDLKDQTAVLDDIILEKEITSANDVNADGILNILDATDSTFMDIYNGEEVSDILANTLVLANEEVLIGETVQVQLYISGLTSANIYGIEGLLNFDNSILELVGVSLYVNEDVEEVQEDLGSLNFENGKFAYVLVNGFNSVDEAILTLEFEAIAAGTSEVSISDIIESYGKAFALENDKVTATLVVEDPEDNKGGDEEETIPGEEEKPEDDTTTDSTENTAGTTTEVDKDTTVAVVTPVVKSSNYYISSLVIDGYEIDFDMYTYEYNITVGADVTSLDMDVLLHDSKAIYYVEGNENFEEGENLVRLVVKAENGSTKTYTIKVEKEAEKEDVVKNDSNELDEEEEEENSSVSKTIIIILIILVIIGLIYVIFKDDEEDKKDTKVEKTEPKKSESVKKENKTTKSTTNKSTKTSNNNTKKSTKKVNKK